MNRILNRVVTAGIGVGMKPPRSWYIWKQILTYVRGVEVSNRICFGCGMGYLYDKNKKAYKISRNNSLQEVKDIVESIKKINTENAG